MRISISLFFIAIAISLLVFCSCRSSFSHKERAQDLLSIRITDDKGNEYSPYILTITNEQGQYIYSHVLTEGITGKIHLQGVKPGLYQLHLSATKSQITFIKHIEYTGGYREENVEVGANQLVERENTF